MRERRLRLFAIAALAIGLGACASGNIKPANCPEGTQRLEGCPPVGAIDDPQIRRIYDERTWRSSKELDFDPIALATDSEAPINYAQAKFIGSTDEESLRSLAVKLHMIEQAEHTVDAVYYIFRGDFIGLAVLGALCDAVQRGVDVRIMVDSLGSLTLNKKYLRALESCALDAGFIRNADGELTIYKARVQPVIFNAASRVFVNHNRRSHDKLLITDGQFPDKALVITGGRNISRDYYGILPDGSYNPKTYLDAEIFLRGGDVEGVEEYGVGAVSEYYYSFLFLFRNNNRVQKTSLRSPKSAYRNARELMRDHYEDLIALPRLQDELADMPDFFVSGFHDAQVRLAHDMLNMTNRRVRYNAVENAEQNPNSIASVLGTLQDEEFDNLQVVSPYLFSALYRKKDGTIELDESRDILQWLNEHPDRSIDIVTNSVISASSRFTQSVVDMDTAPRLLLSEDVQEAWRMKPGESELNPELVESAEWAEMVNHPRIRFHQTGTMNSHLFGGDTEYPNQHGKYIVTDDVGFVGTTNFDYRSRLYNNEMGFLFVSRSLADDVRENTAYLMSLSYRWGSPEWLEMRAILMEQKGSKAKMTRKQRSTYRFLKGTGLKWYF